ncbi:MAG: SBBP repeat-containing protein [Candidatus Zixiibacteriota bacterium]
MSATHRNAPLLALWAGLAGACLFLTVATPSARSGAVVQTPPVYSVDNLPTAGSQGRDDGRGGIAFTENCGQWDEQVLFQVAASEATVWLCRDGLCYSLVHRTTATPGIEPHIVDRERAAGAAAGPTASAGVECVTVRATFVGAHSEVSAAGVGPLTQRSNFFLGNDPSRWRTDVRIFARVVYHDIRPGIDLWLEGRDGDLTARCEAASATHDPAVQLHYETYGSRARAAVATDGGLTLETPWSVMEFPGSIPVADGTRSTLIRDAAGIPAPTAVAVGDGGTSAGGLTFAYSTFLGGGSVDWGYGIDVDTSGAAIVVGLTYSTDFDTVRAFRGDQPGTDAFITKLAPDGSGPVYSTYFGGNDYDRANAVAAGQDGSACVVGLTWSSDFPLEHPLQDDSAYVDAFVARISPDGDSLEFSTYLGGNGSDEAHAVVIDAAGDVCVAGMTTSPQFPTVNPHQPYQGAADAFVARIDASGGSLLYCTCIGGHSDDHAFDVDVDGVGNIYMTGYTLSSDFPTINPFQTYRGTQDAFVLKLNSTTNTLAFSTYLGGSSDDEGRGIALDQNGGIYVAGNTFSSDFPLVDPYQTDQGTLDVFVTKWSAGGGTPAYSTYLGGSQVEAVSAMTVSETGNAWIIGYTSSPDFPSIDAIQSYMGAGDAFLTKLHLNGHSPVFSTYLGGQGHDIGRGIARDAKHGIYITGQSGSSDFPTANPHHGYRGYDDAFATRFIESPCACDCFGNPDCVEHRVDVFDVVMTINVAFRGAPAVVDPDSDCPRDVTDVDCNGLTDISDVLKFVNVAFRNALPSVEFCDPCGP